MYISKLISISLLLFIIHGNSALAQEEFKDCEDCPLLITINPGSMERQDNQNGPNFTVNIEKPFAITKLEITVKEFKLFIQDSGYLVESGCTMFTTQGGQFNPAGSWENPKYKAKDDMPVACVSIFDAEAYASWISEKTGQIYRLPSETEWQFTARSGNPNSSKWYTTGFMKTGDANCADCFGQDVMGREDLLQPLSVGGKANSFGVVAILGNVAEWTADCPGESFENAPTNNLARTDGDCNIRMARGGTFHHKWNELSSQRNPYKIGIRRNDVGIRLVREL